MTALISTAIATLARTQLGRFRVHTATITPSTEGTEDIYFDAADTPGTPRTGVACKYVPADTLRVDDDGRVTSRAPTLMVAYDDALAVGDRVSNIVDADGTVLAAGPLVVQSIVPAAGLGYSLKRTAILAGAGVAE
jgi:hypothetical protein